MQVLFLSFLCVCISFVAYEKCLKNFFFTFSGIGCPIRDDPANGSSNQLTPRLIQYMCDDGYDFSDEALSISLCDPTSGQWSGPVPTCISKFIDFLSVLTVVSHQ